MASAVPVLSREESNFLRVANLLIRLSPKAVRILFDKEFNPGGLKSTFSKNWTKLDKLKKKHVLTQTQWSLLYPSGSDPKSIDFDLTLMVCLLRNLTKINIQDQLPQPSDMSEGAAVSRIKFYRNQIAHSDSGVMSDANFNTTFASVSKAIETLCSTMKSDCTTLKNADLDYSFHEIYVEFVKKEKQLEELTAQVETLNLEIHNIQSIQAEELSEWKKKLGKFYVTEAATKLVKVVEENQYTIITGIPGSGKSALAYHVAIHMEKTEGYTILPVWLPSEMIKMANSDIKQLFVFDDIFGKYSLNECNLNCWESETRRIKMLLKSKLLKVLVTCRSYLYDTVRDSLSSQSFEQFNLQSNEINLSLAERKEISKLYLTDDVVGQLNDDTIMMYSFFPLLCVMFNEHLMENVDFFQNPNQFIKNEIENIKSRNDMSFIALALLVLSNNSIKKEGLQIGTDTYDSMLQDLCDEMDTRTSPSKTSILTNLQSLKNMYLAEKNSIFCTKHDKIFDIISHTVGKLVLRCILSHGEATFISNRCQIFSLNEQHDECTIMITDELETMYFERIFRDIENGHNWEVFASIQMKFEKYRKLFMQYLKKMSPKFASSINDFTTPLHVTAAKGYFDISKYLLKQNRDNINSLDDYKRSPLHQAAMNGHHEITQLFLRNGAKVNMQMINGMTPLYIACNYGHLLAVKLLLESKADVNKCENNKCSPLNLACLDGCKDIAEMLILNCADVNQFNDRKETPLYNACKRNHIDIVNLLLKHGSDVDIASSTGMTPITLACNFGYLKVLKLLLHHKADDKKSKQFGSIPLNIACRKGNADIVNLLLEHDASINQSDKNGYTPLHLACQYYKKNEPALLINEVTEISKVNWEEHIALLFAGENRHTEIAMLLLENGAEVNSPDKHGRTPLYSASEDGNIDLITMLLEHNADVNFQSDNGFTPIHIACQNEHLEAVKILVSYGADINKCDKIGCNSLHVASHFYHKDVDGYLCDNSAAEVNFLDKECESPLHIACKIGNTDIVTFLLKHGASVDHCNTNGLTPFHRACFYDMKYMILTDDPYSRKRFKARMDEIAVVLLDNGAEVNLADKNGRTLLHRAVKDKNIDLIKILMKHDANVNLQMNNGKTPIHFACRTNHLEAVQMLLSYKADINKCDENGWTPLHVASHDNHKEIVASLCEHSAAEVNMSDKNGNSPLHLACGNGYKNVAEILIKAGAFVNKVNGTGSSPLLLACINKSLFFIKPWLEEKICTCDGRIAPICVAKHINVDLIKFLIEYDADVNIQMNNGRTPIFIASENDNLEAVKMLFNYKADINICEVNGWSPLHVASYNNHKEIVAYLCDYSAEVVNLFNQNGSTPLHLACQNGNKDIVQLLLKHAASVKNCDETALTTIHKANSKDNSKIVQLLIKEDAAINITDRTERTPLYIACDSGYPDLVKLILKHGAEVNQAAQVEYREGWTPLHVSVSSGNTDITELLLQNTATVNVVDRKGHTPLFYATKQNFVGIIERLYCHGAKLSNNDVKCLSLSRGPETSSVVLGILGGFLAIYCNVWNV